MATGRKGSAKASKGKLKAKSESQVVVKEFAGRSAFWAQNPSAKEIWLALGETAVKEEGIWLKKETATPVVIEGYTGPISCITTAEEGEFVFAEF